jgi:hypothetical protein
MVDGETVLIVLRREADAWTPSSFIRLHMDSEKIDRVVDYAHCPWIASLAEPLVIDDPRKKA